MTDDERETYAIAVQGSLPLQLFEDFETAKAWYEELPDTRRDSIGVFWPVPLERGECDD